MGCPGGGGGGGGGGRGERLISPPCICKCNEPWAYIFSKGCYTGLIFGQEGLIIGRNFTFENMSGLTIKTA